ncbi:MAG: hypothetical protein P8104_10390, partial [Gammaproteobacteria bacterium]
MTQQAGSALAPSAALPLVPSVDAEGADPMNAIASERIFATNAPVHVDVLQAANAHSTSPESTIIPAPFRTPNHLPVDIDLFWRQVRYRKRSAEDAHGDAV